MRVCVALENRFRRLPDGSVWTQVQFDASFWRRYLEVFDDLRCIARVQAVSHVPGDWLRADGSGVTFSDIPCYIGPAQYVTHLASIRGAVQRAIRPGDAFVLRVPGAVGSLVAKRLDAAGYPYAVEVVGDPYDVFAPGAVRHPLRPLFRWHMTRQLRSQCAHASAACYVTARALQQRYPSTGPAIAASTIELREEAFAIHARQFVAGAGPTKLVFVGSLDQYYKAPDVLIDAVAQVVARGLDVRLTVIGDGRHRIELEALAARLGQEDRVRFTGHLEPRLLSAELDNADLFVLPSRTEGLPRAMIEAMARGLPCIGGSVGGIPELLPADAQVAPGDARGLTDKICQLVRDPARLSRMSSRNLEVARAYQHPILRARRQQFYALVRKTTEAWLHERPRRILPMRSL
jgi:glycosyltransferase involved in cell wall biosynthesis